ncbi:MAG: type II and III secretion system protein [Synechococcaceae cyanobacterium SM2_3_2]|nr:type II and III secretion system protein [Synechococcaceae cyanobacterium SM2_3_2]
MTDPRIVVSDGGSGRIEIGSQVPVNVERSTQVVNDVPVVSETLVRESAGIDLTVNRVRIDDNGFVTIDLLPRVRAPIAAGVLSGGQFAGTQLFNIDTREVGLNQIRLRDGETYFLAGLIEERETVSVSRVPLLSQIPILGSLFRSQSTGSVRN